MSTTNQMTPLTDEEQRAFGHLTGVLNGDYDNVRSAILRATLDGETDVAVVVSVHFTDEAIAMHPLAILLDDGPLTERLTPAGDAEVTDGLMTTQGSSMNIEVQGATL